MAMASSCFSHILSTAMAMASSCFSAPEASSMAMALTSSSYSAPESSSMALPSSSYSAPEPSSWKYDVFLSFRGEDTRKTFVDHLYSALTERTIRTYKDDEALPRGESIAPSLFKAIEESKFAVIIFSENYADSSWCLQELAHIMKCKDERDLIVMPVFYDVDPSDVRKQQRKFGEAFAKHEETEKTESWRKALVDASNIAGWEPKNIANGCESTVIKRIVDTILDRLLSLSSEIDEELIGMKARLQDLKTRLEVGSGGVRMVGIWGVGGGGKTTLANYAYTEISHHFEGCCIVENIREESCKYGLKKLQENILSAVLKKEVKVHSVAEGKRMLKSRLCHSNVLILLDDVDDVSQLEALAGSHSWFGSGSRIIITTRNEHLLRTHKVDKVYHVRLLSNEEAIQLFNKRAYNKEKPVKDYEELSLSVVSYAAGLPLALKVLGSFLYDKENDEWMSTLARLKDIPETEILQQLKISFDGLRTVEKELFLDIACFFRGESTDNTDFAMEILKACGLHPDIGITVLRQKSLINIVDGEFDMHDLVQEMGHYIVRGEHPSNPEKHSRVWKEEEINDMCLGDSTMVNDKIEAIMYNNAYDRDALGISKIVSNMKNLRWLHLKTYADEFVEGPNFLSNELRYINWSNYPSSSFPDNFQPLKLVVLKLFGSFQKELWKGYKRLPHLKVLELVSMEKLLRTPDFDGLPCLQKFTIIRCEELEEIHPSFGNHRRLEYVKVWHCYKLKKVPKIVCMEKLETLIIRGCDVMVEFPEIQANMGSLVNLHLVSNGIEVVPSSIGVHCTHLLSLRLGSCRNIKSIDFDFHAFKHLKEFSCWDITGCHLKDEEIWSHIGSLSNLRELDLSYNDFTRLPFSLLKHTQLKLLRLNHCYNLVELPELPSSIVIFEAERCYSLASIGDNYTSCKWLSHVSLTRDADVSLIDGSRLLESMLEGNAIGNHSFILHLRGLEIAKGFRPPLIRYTRSSRCRLQLPQNWSNHFSGFLLCFVMSHVYPYPRDLPVISMKHLMSGITCEDDDAVWEASRRDDHTLVLYVSFGSLRHTAWWDDTKNLVTFSIKEFDMGVVSGFGVRLVGGSKTSTTTTQPEPDFSDYIPIVHIVKDLRHDLCITAKPHKSKW